MSVDSLNKLPGFGGALKDRVKSKRNTSKDIRTVKARMSRVVNKATEVIVKVSGGVKGATHLKAHMDYISRNGKIDLENERGEKLETREQIREEHKKWTEDLGPARKNRRDSVNLVLSMPEGTDPEAVRRAVRKFAADQFKSNHDYLMALHHPGNDPETKTHKGTKQPHVHLTVKALGYDGTKLDPRKDDLQFWREQFAEQMRAQGVEAEATPRRSRGVVKKAKKQAIWSMENRRGKASKVTAAKLTDAAQELISDKPSGNPHRAAIVAQQAGIRAAWLSDATTLAQSDSVADRALAKQIQTFVGGLPSRLLDEREELKLQIAAKVNKQRQQAKNVGQGVEKTTGQKAPSQVNKDRNEPER